jgi:general L-amino acid transport system substrate-binding protein
LAAEASERSSMSIRKQTSATLLCATLLSIMAGATCNGAAAQTLKAVKDRGELICGVSHGLPGFAAPDSSGAWSGIDVDYCRAVAAAVFHDPEKVRFMPLGVEERFDVLKSGKIDVLAHNSTWTMSRETDFGLTFVGVNYYDGQGFLVHRSPEIASALELDGAKVCVQKGTTTIDNLEDYFKSNNLKYEAVGEASQDDARKDYEAGKCNVLTSDVSQLYALRLQMANPRDHVILPDVISKEPLGLAVRQDDTQWAEIVKWVDFALINAEELGISSKNVDEALKSTKPAVRRLMGLDGDFGPKMGLSSDWAANAIRAVGNYGEVYERDVGSKSKLGIPRGLNELWNLGGIQYAPPIR